MDLLNQEQRVSLKPFLGPKGNLCWAYVDPRLALAAYAGAIFLVRDIGAKFEVNR